jgi:hypothetical protein
MTFGSEEYIKYGVEQFKKRNTYAPMFEKYFNELTEEEGYEQVRYWCKETIHDWSRS